MTVTDVGDSRRLLRSHASGNASVGVIRDKREQTISLPVQTQALRMLEESFRSAGNPRDIDLAEVREDIANGTANSIAVRNAGQAARDGMAAARKAMAENQIRMKMTTKNWRELRQLQRECP